ncbi:MAG TPA: electron transport complex subunit RsxC [bacterium]|nr:electron transport complex subunit RsxC [bacterium]
MFRGGVEFIDFKSLSKEEPIENFKEPDKVVIPLSQHTGIPAKLVVRKGDNVLKGQVIGEIAGFISSSVHSSISGKVIGVEDILTHTYKISPAVIIENDGSGKEIEKKKNDWFSLSPSEIIELVSKNGVVGLGGATFPSHVKLVIPHGKKCEAVILNGCECEPFLTCDYRVLKENTEDVIIGLEIICKTLGVKKAYIGIEQNKIDIAEKIKKVIKNKSCEIELKVLPKKYPQGSEKHLIKSITGKEVPSGGLPIDVGIVVFNVQTAISIKNAVCDGEPLIERVITVSGLVERPKNLRVKIGTSISEVITYCEGELEEGSKIVIGGPMMGMNIPSSDIPVIKGTTGILILPEEILPEEIEPCIRCGKCIDACPMNLCPAEIGRYAELKKWEEVEKLSVSDCIECGCCSYICPSKRPLVELFKWAKTKIKRKKE